MSKVNQLFERKLSVVNFGIESFYQDLIKQGKSAVHVDWKPVAGGDKKIAACLRDPSKQELMTSADAVALARRIDALGSEELETKNSKSGGAGSTTRGARNTAPAA